MWVDPINVEEFVRRVKPALESASAEELARIVRQRWCPRQICGLLQHERTDVRKLACVALGLVGDLSVVNCLSEALKDADQRVSELAEHGMWSIWFRSGSEQATPFFKRGLAALEHENPREAIFWFQQAHCVDPHFAEAYNQCAIAHAMLDQWSEALDDCERTVRQAPRHFGALAAMGHGYAQLGKLSEAAECYCRALEVNPRMHIVAEALGEIERDLATG